MSRQSEIMNLKSEILNRKSAGFTLLEVILALSLSTIVVGAVGLGIFVYYRAFDSGRSDVEEAQLARALLSRIAEDIRGAVPYCPMDAEGLVPQASSSASGTGGTSSETAGGTSSGTSSGTNGTSSGTGGTSGDASGTGGASGDASGDGSTSGDGTSSSTTASLAASVVPPSTPGLYGNDSVLLVDVSHLPRLDQYDAMAVAIGEAAVPDQLSDVKTVTYFVNSAGLGNTAGGTGATGSGSDQQSGLVRRELDRAVAVWSEQQGSAAFPPPLAPEVGRISFTYFDGSEWATEWDTVSMGSLPVAVRVEIAMIPRQKNKGGPLSSGSDEPFVEDPKHVYSMVVRLPSSQAARANSSPTATEEPTEEPTDTSGAGTSGAGTSGGSGTSGTGTSGTGTSGTGTSGTGSGMGTGGSGSKTSGSGSGTGGDKSKQGGGG